MRKIIYLVGAYGCGKTTTTQKLASKTPRSDCILEDRPILEVLKSIKDGKMPIADLYVLMTYYYRIIEKLYKDIDYLFVDSHPLLPSIYLRANFEMNNGFDVNLRDLMEFGRIRYQMNDITRHFFDGIRQEIIYINLPAEEHYDMVLERYDERSDDFPFEDDPDWFTTVRRILNSEIYHVGEHLYGCDIIEINSLDKIDELNWL